MTARLAKELPSFIFGIPPNRVPSDRQGVAPAKGASREATMKASSPIAEFIFSKAQRQRLDVGARQVQEGLGLDHRHGLTSAARP